MNMMQMGALGVCIVCALALAGLVIIALIDSARVTRREREYKRGWKSWWKVTQISRDDE